jgi:sulfur carrier protein ThiS
LRFTRSKSTKGNALPSHASLQIIFNHDLKLADLLRHNSFSGQHTVARSPPVVDVNMRPAPGPYPRDITESDVVRILSFVQKASGQLKADYISLGVAALSSLLNIPAQNLAQSIRERRTLEFTLLACHICID